MGKVFTVRMGSVSRQIDLRTSVVALLLLLVLLAVVFLSLSLGKWCCRLCR